jgi:hypothetical protein
MLVLTLSIFRETRRNLLTFISSQSSGVEECISCIRIDGRMNSAQFEDYKPFIPGSHFSAYDTENFRKIGCPDCEQLVDPYMVQVHRRTDCFNKHKLETRCRLCGRHMLLTNLVRHMETHGPKRYMCSCCGRKFHKLDYF